MNRLRWTVPAVALLSGSSAFAQTAPAAQRTDLYHVHFAQAAGGKSAELQKSYSTLEPDGAHTLVLRHAEGSPWDFVVISHIGPKATIEAGGPANPDRELRSWHEDTFAAGPSWDVFAKAMGFDAASANAIYIVGTYRGAAGHRAQLEKTLGQIQAAAAKPDSGVVLQHVEGGNWDYLTIGRYDSWSSLAAEQTDPAGEQRERKAGLTSSPGLALREHMSFHTDTITVRVPTQVTK